jgi:hypothetical protein
MNKLDKIKVLLGMEVEEQTENVTAEELAEAKEQMQFEDAQLEDGTIVSADAFEVGNAVFIIVEEDKQPLPVGEYAMADGSLLVIEEEGIIAEIREADAETEEVVEEEVVEEQSTEEMSTDNSKEAIIEAIGVMENLLQEFTSLKEEFASMKAKAQDDAQKVEEFEAVGEEIKPNPEGNGVVEMSKVDFSKLSKSERVQYLINTNK